MTFKIYLKCNTRNLDFNDDGVGAQLILSSKAVAACIKVGDVTQREDGMALLCLHIVVAAGLDRLSLTLPRDAGSWIADEGYLDDSVLTLVEEGSVAEPWRNVDLRGHCKREQWIMVVTRMKQPTSNTRGYH